MAVPRQRELNNRHRRCAACDSSGARRSTDSDDMTLFPRTLRLALPAAALAGVLLVPSSALAATCDDHPTQASAQRAKDTRDTDGDGIYCESNPCPCLGAGSGGSGSGDRAAARRRQRQAAAQRRREAAARRRRAAARRRAAERRRKAERRRRYEAYDDSTWRIVDVVDGDTIKVAKIGGRAPRSRITVRLLGIDTPETREPNTPVECGGREATSHMLAASFTAAADTDGDGLFDTKGGEGRQVDLETDQSQDLYDAFGRLLAYGAVAPDGAPLDLGEAMLAAGWAEVFVFERDFRRALAYRRVAAEAQGAGAGVHAKCGGDFHRAP